MAFFVPPPTSVDGVTLTQDTAGTLSVLKGGEVALQQQSGSSSSGTPGTAIATLTATAGSVLTDWWVFTLTGASGSQVRVTITYEDDTTESLDLTGASDEYLTSYLGAGNHTTGSGFQTWSSGIAAQRVKQVAATTLGAGVSARSTTIVAKEVYQ